MKSTYRRSRGAVANIGHKGALGMPPPYWCQHVQALISCLICLAIPGHQKCSSNKDNVWSQPWCPASQWYPFKAAVQCAFSTMKSNRSSFSHLGMEQRYRMSWRTMKFWWFLHTIQPSSLEACSPRSVLRSVFFIASNQHSTASTSESSFWAADQLVTCISTRTHPAATHTSFSFSWSPSTMAGSSPSVLWVAPKVAPSRMDCMASRPRWVVIQPSTSATVLSCPFWYSNQKLNFVSFT